MLYICFLFYFQHENIYRGLLRSLLHPLGAPDVTIGLRPGDLLDHLREVKVTKALFSCCMSMQ